MTGLLPWQTQYSTETRTYGIDLSLDMDQGDSLGSATSTLTDLLTGIAVNGAPMLPSGPTVSGTTITQVVTGLTPGRNYRLLLSGAMGGSKVTAASLSIFCPF